MSSNKLVPLTVNDLTVRDGAYYLSHHVLAQRLGVQASNLMRVIKLLCEEDESFGAFDHLVRFEEMVPRPQGGGFEREHILLNEKQAITVTLESRSKRRHELRNEIVDVYLAVKNGPQPGDGGVYDAVEARIIARMEDRIIALVATSVAQMVAVFAPRVADVERRQMTLEHSLLRAEARRNRISESGRTKISVLLARIAAANARAKGTSVRAERTRAQMRLASFIGWSGECRSFDNIPGNMEGPAISHLEAEYRRAVDGAEAREQVLLDGFDEDDYLASLRTKRRT